MIIFMTLLLKETRRFLVVWEQTILGPMISAFLYELIFGNVFSNIAINSHGTPYAEFLIPGLVIMQVLVGSIANSSSSIILSKYHGNIIFLLMAPISAYTMLNSYLIACILRSMIVSIVIFIALSIFSFSMPSSILLYLLYVILGSIISGGLGIIIGVLSSSFNSSTAIITFFWTPLIYLSGIFYNINNFSLFWRRVAAFDPIYYLVKGFRDLFIYNPIENLSLDIAVPTFFSVVIYLIGFFLIKKGIKLKS